MGGRERPLAGGVQIAGPQARPARRPGDPGPRLGARGAPAARGGRGGYAHPLPRAAPAGQRVGPRGQNTATTLRGRFLPPSTYAGEDPGAAAPEKRQGREAPAGLGLAFLTGGASARTAAPQGPAGALSAGAGLRGRRTAAARRAAAEAATTAGAGRAAPRMVARATDYSLPRPAASRGKENGSARFRDRCHFSIVRTKCPPRRRKNSLP